MRRLAASFCLAVLAAFGPVPATAQDAVRLAAPQSLVQTGLMEYVLPRFSLKTGVRVEIVAPDAKADLALTNQSAGTPVFRGPGATWSLMRVGEGHEDAARFAEWLSGEIGLRTVTSYEVDGTALFTPPPVKEQKVVEASFDGDAVLGRKLSGDLCGRCHTVTEDDRMSDIGSTPSFFVLRAMPDWGRRFQSFYALNPHPAFTQVDEVTPPFPMDRPSPIIPVEMTLDDLDAILAYVSALTPADLGAPIQHQ